MEPTAIKDAADALQAEFEACDARYWERPRLMAMADRYNRRASNARYALRCAREALQSRNRGAVLKCLKREAAALRSLNDALAEDPYVCKSPDKAQHWAERRRTGNGYGGPASPLHPLHGVSP